MVKNSQQVYWKNKCASIFFVLAALAEEDETLKCYMCEEATYDCLAEKQIVEACKESFYGSITTNPDWACLKIKYRKKSEIFVYQYDIR